MKSLKTNVRPIIEAIVIFGIVAVMVMLYGRGIEPSAMLTLYKSGLIAAGLGAFVMLVLMKANPFHKDCEWYVGMLLVWWGIVGVFLQAVGALAGNMALIVVFGVLALVMFAFGILMLEDDR